MLRELGHQVCFASDGIAGLAPIERERPAVVFSDVWTPGMSGLELCDALRARPALAQILIVLITASVQRDELAASFRHGATAILKKPFLPHRATRRCRTL
jgi:CheY-like chemotaxis protein